VKAYWEKGIRNDFRQAEEVEFLNTRRALKRLEHRLSQTPRKATTGLFGSIGILLSNSEHLGWPLAILSF
jgi:hypothetical protein